MNKEESPISLFALSLALLLSAPAVALHGGDHHPYTVFTVLVDGAEVPVAEGVVNSKIHFESTIKIKFTPENPEESCPSAAQNFGSEDFDIEGGTFENFSNTSPDNWHDNGPDYNTPDSSGTEWTVDLIPVRVAGQGFVDVTVTSLGNGWRAFRCTGSPANLQKNVTFRVTEQTPASVLWFLLQRSVDPDD